MSRYPSFDAVNEREDIATVIAEDRTGPQRVVGASSFRSVISRNGAYIDELTESRVGVCNVSWFLTMDVPMNHRFL